MKNSRRDFLKKGALAGFSALMIPEIAKAAVKENTSVHAPKINLKKDCVILFQGDSITDCGRDRNSNRCNTMEQFGSGYVLFTATQLLEGKAALQPDVLSILIGVNDYWHTLTHGYKGTVETYENDLRALLKYTKEKLPNTQIVLCEPFTLRDGAAIEDSKWYPMFDEFRKSARKLSEEFNTIFVPFQSGFDAAVKLAPARYWSNDGVHPDLPGRQLMANMWMEATGLK